MTMTIGQKSESYIRDDYPELVEDVIGFLDELVFDHFSESSSEINNQGISGQIDAFVNARNTRTVFEEILLAFDIDLYFIIAEF